MVNHFRHMEIAFIIYNIWTYYDGIDGNYKNSYNVGPPGYKLVITPITTAYGTYNYSYWGL